MKKEFIVLKPQYMSEFQCIGAACSDTCCSGWRVDIDKRTYKNYRKINDKKMATKISEQVKRNKDNKNEDLYASIQTNGGNCGFLNNGLCDIQLNLGEDYLSKTCLSYPRVFNNVDGQVELSAKLSCPEIARLVLLNPEKMEFNIEEEQLDTRHSYRMTMNSSQSIWHSCFWQVRSFVIEILQNRNYTISQRLIFLGFFCEKLFNISRSSFFTQSQIMNVINEFQTKMHNPSTKIQITDLPKVLHVQIKLLMEMLQPRKSNHIRYNNYSEQTSIAFALDTMDQTIVEERYSEGYNNYYKPFIEEHSYILENYLVNQVFERTFLFNRSSDILEEYTLLVSLYSMLRFHIQGVAAYTKQMSVNEAMSIIQAFSKVIDHSPLFLKSLTDHIKNSNFDTWALLTILVKE
ncbi:flagellin lysine-N-methylase [Paenibacillus lautus]|uniref:flagellin lysine-N-methylase n=1 Tax=Paenibacillus lautus TaxID=1401 RepID=UPI002FBD4052|nr:flagellin lysine-N-methylase [Cytobacillus firmus]